MTSRTRLWVLAISTPIIVFALVGGYLGQALAKDDTYQHLRVFDDVISLVVNNYVEEVDLKQAMRGAMRGLADALDADSAFLTPDLVRTVESNSSAGPADVGIELIRQYYLRVVSARTDRRPPRPGSAPATSSARSTTSPHATCRRTKARVCCAARPAPRSRCSSSAATPPIRTTSTLVRERIAGPELTSRMANPTTGYVRIVDFTKESPAKIKQAFDALAKTGATRYVIDLRGTARGDLDDGVAAARLFVRAGMLTVKQTKTGRDVVSAQVADARDHARRWNCSSIRARRLRPKCLPRRSPATTARSSSANARSDAPRASSS